MHEKLGASVKNLQYFPAMSETFLLKNDHFLILTTDVFLGKIQNGVQMIFFCKQTTLSHFQLFVINACFFNSSLLSRAPSPPITEEDEETSYGGLVLLTNTCRKYLLENQVKAVITRCSIVCFADQNVTVLNH